MTVEPPRRVIILTLLLGYVVFLAVAGLNPRDLSRGNDVTWLPDGPGIRFDGHGLAYTAAPRAVGQGGMPSAFTLLVDLKLAASSAGRGFEHVVTVFAEDTDSQLLIGQWKTSLIATNGADYDYRQRRPRLSANLDPGDNRWHLLVVAADGAGTRLYIDGQEVAAMAEMLTLPGDGDFRVLLGNSVHGNQGWRGLIRGVALLPRALDAAEISELSRRRGGVTLLDGSGLEQPALLFVFGEGRGSRSADLGTRGLALSFPPDRVILAPEFFQPGFRDARLADVMVNLLGFVPFGFLGVLLLLRAGSAPRTLSRRVVLLAATGAGVALSACIELAQAWMPMRSSSLLDLLLNASGTFGGALAGLLSMRQVERLLGPGPQRES